MIRRGEETREEASEMGGVEGASDEWREWVAPGGLKQLKQTGPLLMSCFCLPKKFIMIKEVLVSYGEKFCRAAKF